MKHKGLTLLGGALSGLKLPNPVEGQQYKENQLVANKSALSMRVGNQWKPLAILSDLLYDFMGVTLTNAGLSGRAGPSQTQLTNAYRAQYPWVMDAAAFSSAAGVQIWTVPTNGQYRFRVVGAAYSGTRAVVTATFTLKRGDKLRIIVGQNGSNAQAGCGASSVALGTRALIVAGGGPGYRGVGATPGLANLAAPGTGIAGTTAWSGRFADNGASGQGAASFTTAGVVGSGSGGQAPQPHRGTPTGGTGNRPNNLAGTPYDGGFGGGGGCSATTDHVGCGGGGGFTGGIGSAREIAVTHAGAPGTSYVASDAVNASAATQAGAPSVAIELLL